MYISHHPQPPCILRLPRARVAGMTPVNLSIPPGPFNSFQQVELLPLWFNQLTGILHEIKTIRKMGLKKTCWDILCRHILPLMQKQNVLWLFVHTGQFRSSTATNFLAMTSHTWESTSNLQCSDGNFLPWRLVVTSSSATRIHDSLLRAAVGVSLLSGCNFGGSFSCFQCLE